MRRPIRLALFDIGNTLLYDDPAAWPEVYRLAEQALWKSLHATGVAFAQDGFYGRHESILSYYYDLRATSLDEPGTAVVLNDLLKKHNMRVSPVQLQTALRAMYAATQTNWYLEQDAISTLQTLRNAGLRLGVISNGSDDTNAHELLKKAELKQYFEYVLTSAAFGKRKPDPGIFRAALDYYSVSPERAVMIGDSLQADIRGAGTLGINTIWVRRRSQEELDPELGQPDAIVDSLSEIPTLVT